MRTLITRAAMVAAGAVLAGALWWRKHPSACPYGQRFWIEAPHPFITRKRLIGALEPRPGNRILEVGPGTGYYSLPVASALEPGGTLDIFDIQQAMLDHTTGRARDAGIVNIKPTQGDARSLPYHDDTFDAAYLVTVLGEIPDPERALTELARVLRPGGRLVVGELFGDPHWTSPAKLEALAVAAGFLSDLRVGSALAYFARFTAYI